MHLLLTFNNSCFKLKFPIVVVDVGKNQEEEDEREKKETHQVNNNGKLKIDCMIENANQQGIQFKSFPQFPFVHFT